jgi:hypothetical protein
VQLVPKFGLSPDRDVVKRPPPSCACSLLWLEVQQNSFSFDSQNGESKELFTFQVTDNPNGSLSAKSSSVCDRLNVVDLELHRSDSRFRVSHLSGQVTYQIVGDFLPSVSALQIAAFAQKPYVVRVQAIALSNR